MKWLQGVSRLQLWDQARREIIRVLPFLQVQAGKNKVLEVRAEPDLTSTLVTRLTVHLKRDHFQQGVLNLTVSFHACALLQHVPNPPLPPLGKDESSAIPFSHFRPRNIFQASRNSLDSHSLTRQLFLQLRFLSLQVFLSIMGNPLPLFSENDRCRARMEWRTNILTLFATLFIF